MDVRPDTSPTERAATAEPHVTQRAEGAGRAGDLLAIYLNDHLAVGIGWRELARRAQRNNVGSPLGDALAVVGEGIAQDVATLEAIMERLGVPKSPLKGPLAVAGERLSRLKLNGRLTTYSPLSRFLELDVLTMGIEGKVQFWQTLRDAATLGARLSDVDFDDLMQRARAQRETLETFRIQAGIDAFSPSEGRAQ